MPAPIIPYDPRHEVFCPFCMSIDTEYHPSLRWGRCHAAGCGRAWRFDPYSKPNPAVPGIDAPAATGHMRRSR